MSVICLLAKGKTRGGSGSREKKKKGETCRTIEGVISSVMTLNDVSYPRLCQWQQSIYIYIYIEYMDFYFEIIE